MAFNILSTCFCQGVENTYFLMTILVLNVGFELSFEGLNYSITDHASIMSMFDGFGGPFGSRTQVHELR